MPPQCKTIRLHRTELSCHCCFPSWSVTHIKQIGEQCRGMHRMESALINLQISSMWRSSYHCPYSLHFSRYDYSERTRKNQRISCNAARDQLYTNSSQPCKTQQHIHSVGLSVDSIQSGTFFFCPLLCPCNFWHFAKVLPTCLFSLLSIDVMAALLSLSIVCKTHIILLIRLCVSSLFYTF